MINPDEPEASIEDDREAITVPEPKPKARRGFAAMSPEQQRAIARLGGKAAHAKGTAHEFSSEEARVAGLKGGQATRRSRQERSKKKA